MHVAHIAPEFPAYQKKFACALARVGARVSGIGEREPWALDDELKRHLSDYERVHSVADQGAVLAAARRLAERAPLDRIEATIETHILTTARVREALDLPGQSVEGALLCRDKAAMKAHLREHDVRCAASSEVNSDAELRAFVDQHGYPIILKPRDGAGASGTWKIEDDATLYHAARELGVGEGGWVAAEQFIQGHEGFYDTVTVNGEIAHDFISHYYPNVLEGMRTRWISPQIVLSNMEDGLGYDAMREMGRQVIEALDISTSATHMEWFAREDGVYFSEIGARPAGVGHWDLYCAANDIDLYAEWAHAIVHGRCPGRLSRRFAAGIVSVRPEHDGVIAGYGGLEALQRDLGSWIVDAHLPDPGTPTQPVEAGYMANAWVRLRHPDFDTLRGMLDRVGRELTVYAR